jgi:uncharacterized protein YkwD
MKKLLLILVILIGGIILTSCPDNTTNPNIIPKEIIPLDLAAHNVLMYINEFRKENLLDTLNWNAYLATTAGVHTKDMASGKYELGYHGTEARADSINKYIPFSVNYEIVSTTKGNTDDATNVYYLWRDYNRNALLANYKIAGVAVDTSKDGVYYFMIIMVLPK